MVSVYCRKILLVCAFLFGVVFQLLSKRCLPCLQPPTTIAEPNASRMSLLWACISVPGAYTDTRFSRAYCRRALSSCLPARTLSARLGGTLFARQGCALLAHLGRALFARLVWRALFPSQAWRLGIFVLFCARNVFGTCRVCACSHLVHGQSRSAISLSRPTSSGVLPSSTLRAICSLVHSSFFLYPSLPPPSNYSVICVYIIDYIYTFIYLFIYLFICLFIYSCIYLFNYSRITICMCKMLPKQNQISRATSSTPFCSLTSTSVLTCS